jgi:MFS family permease
MSSDQFSLQSRQAGMAVHTRGRTLWLSCIAHALHDGYTDALYVLLPVWQAEFGLGFGTLALLRGIYAGTMASLQLPAGRLAARLGSGATLALGTLLAAAGYALAGMSGSLLGLCVALAISGSGSSTQHPLASGAVSQAFGGAARGPLGVYNFSGDLGKAALPAAMSLLITLMPWRHALWALGALGAAFAVALIALFPAMPRKAPAGQAQIRRGIGAARGGFGLLFAIGILDTGVRMGVLTFLPFLLKDKGIATPMIGTALALVFIGGTAACILAVMACPLPLAMVLLPLLGLMLNGTSSVLYGTVPELAPHDGVERAFALFYTGTIGSGAIAPVLYGVLGDHIGAQGATLAAALTALLILPLALALRSCLTPAAAG